MTTLSQRMVDLGTAKSEIREAFAFAQARAAEVGPENVDDFSIGNPSVPAPDTVAQMAHQLVDTVDPILLHGYTPAQGDASVRRALADDLNRRYGTHYDPDCFYLTAGAAGALCCVLSALGCPGDVFLTFAPYFPEYKVFVESAGGTLTAVPANLEDFQIDFAVLETALSPQVKGVIINSPNNPTGVVYSEETIRKLARLLDEKSREYGHPIWLISDEPYREIVYQQAPLPWVPSYYANTLVCYSYSKSLSLPGQRIGYVLVPRTAEDFDLVYAAVCGAGRALGYVCAPSLFQLVVANCAGQTADIAVYRKNRDLPPHRPAGDGVHLRPAGGGLLPLPPVVGARRQGLLPAGPEVRPGAGPRGQLRLPGPRADLLLRAHGADPAGAAQVPEAGGGVPAITVGTRCPVRPHTAQPLGAQTAKINASPNRASVFCRGPALPLRKS